MKKNLITLGAMLMATLSLTNCMKETPTAPEAAGTPYTLYANYEADTKTVNDGLSTRWAEEDAINVFHTEAGTSWYSESTKFTVTDVETGQFDTELLNGELSAVNDWFALYPYNDYTISPSDEGNGYLTIGGTRNEPQVQTGNDNMTHIAGPNYPMWGIAAGVESSEMPYLRMTHLSSLVEVVVTNATEEDLVVRNVALVATEDITGTYYVDFSTENPVFTLSGDNYVSNVVRLEVAEGEPVAPGASAKFYFAIKPFTAAAGQSLYLSVNGAEKSFDLTNDVTFAPGKLRTMKFNYDGSGAPDTIAEVIEAGEGQAAWTSGIVVAKYNQGFLIEDETGHILVYEKAIPSVNIGDEVYVSGTTSVYAGFLQITAPSVEVVSEDNEVIYPEDVVELDGAALDSMLEASEVQFIKYTGVLTISGSYYNIKVAGAESAVASVSYPLDHFNMADMNGWTVTVEGYLVGIASGKYVNTMATSVVGYEPEPEPELVPGPYSSNLEWTPGANSTIEKAKNINYESDLSVLKIGTSSKVGEATVTIPAGTSKIGFYAVSWKGKEATLALKLGDSVVGSVTPPANDGASNIPPYTIEVDEASCYFEIVVNAEETADYTLTTTSSNKRVIIWGLNYYDADGNLGEDQTTEEPEPEPEPEPDQPGDVIVATIADVLAADVSSEVWYQMTGTITEIVNTTYGNFYLEDETGRIYVYGLTAAPVAKNDKSFSSLGLNVGDIVTIVGTRSDHNGSAEVGGPAYYISHESGSTEPEPEPEPEPDQPGDLVVATVEEVIAAEVSTEVWYQVTGIVRGIYNTTYGNFYLEGDSGQQICVYGLTATPSATNDKSFASLGLKDGDVLTLAGTRSEYGGAPQIEGPAYYISHEAGEEEPEPEVPADGTVASVVFADMGYPNSESVDGEEIMLDENVCLIFSKASAGTAPAYYTSGSAIRMYQNGSTLEVSANGKTITSIEVTFASNHYYMEPDCGEFSAEGPVRTWTGESQNVLFTSTGTDRDHRAYVSAIKVTYVD